MKHLLFAALLIASSAHAGLDFAGLARSMPSKYRALFVETKMCVAFAENAHMIAKRRDAGQTTPNDLGDTYAGAGVRMVADHVYASKTSPTALYASVLAACEKAFKE